MHVADAMVVEALSGRRTKVSFDLRFRVTYDMRSFSFRTSSIYAPRGNSSICENLKEHNTCIVLHVVLYYM